MIKELLIFMQRRVLPRVLMLILCMALVIPAMAQKVDKMSISTQMFLDEQAGRLSFDKSADFTKGANANGITNDDLKRYAKYDRLIASPVEQNGTKFISAFVRVTDRTVLSELEALGVEIQCEFLNGTLFTTMIPVDKIEAVAALAKVTKVSVATKKRPFSNKAREYSNVDDVLTYSTDARNAGLPNAYDGSGVLLGVIDTGIDFQHKAFKDKNGNFRIKRAYVYTGSGSAKEYGDGLTTALSSSAPTTDDSSEDHGTHTSSTAGGSSVIISGSTTTVTDDHSSATYGGMAPGTDLYLAGCDLSDTYLANSFQKIVNYADSKNMPVVVSNSWGSQFGPHDGTGDFADICASYFSDSNPNHICLFAASNDAGTSGFNVSGTASSSSPLGTVMNWNSDFVSYYYGVIASAWTRSTNATLQCKIIIINSSGAKQEEITVNPSSNGSSVSIGTSYVSSGSLVAYRDFSGGSSKSQILLYASSLKMKSGYKLAVQFYPSNGSSVVDVWAAGGYTYYTSTPSTSGYTWTAGSDNNCVSDESTIPTAISIGAYSTKNNVTDYNNRSHSLDYTMGDIADFSSWASASATVTGLQYPWICAPGATVVSGVNAYHTSGSLSYINGNSANYGLYRVNTDTTNPYGSMEGTSMATPAAAGIVALWLQVAKDNNIDLTTSDIKTIMKETAITDSYTNGTNASHFGNGKIDALAGIKYILENYVQNDNPTITATPTTVAFGDQAAGGTYTQTFTVTGANLEGNITLAKSGSSAFTISPTSVTKATAEGNGATITVTFKPTANTTADYTGTVTLTSINATSVTVALSGKGVYSAPVIAANPTSLTFTGNSGSTYTKTVTVNSSNLQGNVTAAIQNDANGFYTVSPTSFNAASQTVTVTWKPTAGGTSTANLVLTTTGTGANTVTVPLTGTAQGPSITANPTSVTFTDAYATRTYTQTVTVTGTNLTQNITASLTGANVYSIDKSSLTRTGGTITVTYAPTAAGTTNATLTLSSTGATSVIVPISGTAQAATPILNVDKSSLTFDTQLNESSSQTITVSGRFLSEDVAVTLTDANNVFSVDKTSLDYATLNNDGTITITVAFNSANEGTFTGTLNLTSGNVSQSVALTGTANDTPTYIYVLTNTLTAGKEYLIVNSNAAGSRYAMGHSNTTVARDAVTVKSDATVADAVYIENDDVDATSVWTAASGYTFKNGNYYVGISSSGNNRTLTFSNSSTNWTYNGTTSRLSAAGGNRTYYLRYNNNTFSVSTIANSIYLYEKTQVVKKPSLTASPTGIDFIAEPGETITETITVTGVRLTQDVTVSLTDENGVYTIDKSSISIAEATNGATVTVTFNAPEQMGSYRGQMTFTSGTASAKTVFYGAVGEKGTAYSNYLDIAQYQTIGTGNWYEGIFANPYKFTEYEDNECAWLTVPAALPYYAWNYNDQNWCGISSNSTGGWYGHQWAATDVFQGYEYFQGTFENETNTYAHMMGGDESNSTSNTTIFYGIYNVTNCTQVKAYAYNNGATSTYPAFIQVYELTENADGTLTQSETRTDIQTSYTSGAVTMTSAELDASKIYFVAVGGYRGFTYEVAFRTPLTQSVTLAELVSKGVPGRTYNVTDLQCVEVIPISENENLLVCKDDAKYENKDACGSDMIDYMSTTYMGRPWGDYDQSNWILLHFNDKMSASPRSHMLTGVTGTYVNDNGNPELILAKMPNIGDIISDYVDNLNTFIVPSLYSSSQISSVNGNTYFFVQPKPMEYARIKWAQWDGAKFIIPDENNNYGTEGTNAYALVGSFAVDQKYMAKEESLVKNNVYEMIGIVQFNASKAGKTVLPTEIYVDNEVITAVKDMKRANGAVEVARYNVSGQRVDRNYRGVVIVMMSDGTAHKTVVK